MSMTGVNLTVAAAKVVANECLSNIVARRRDAVEVVDAAEQAWLLKDEGKWWYIFALFFRVHFIAERIVMYEKRRQRAKTNYLQEEVVAEAVLAAVVHSASPYMYISSIDILLMERVK